jgi:EmrB/QacA subfamily drug resistance transporter
MADTVAEVEREDISAPAAVEMPPGTKPIVAGLMLSMFLVALDGTIVSTAMPSIIGDLGGFKLYAWVPAVYLLTTAVSTPIYGKLADLYGRKPILFTGIGLFLLGSMASGVAPGMLVLIVARAIQGLGAGAVFPITITIIGDTFSLEQRARVQGFFSSVWGISSVIGPLAGGLFVDNVGWRWIFYFNIPFGILAAVVLAMYLHEPGSHREHRLDLLGASLLTVGLTTILLILIEGGQAWDWLSWQSGLLAVVALGALSLFIREETVAPEPVVPLDLFRSRIITVSSLGSLLAGVVMISVSFEIPLFVQGVLGEDALHSGLTLAPLAIGWPIAGAMSGRLAIRFGYRITAVAGAALEVVGVALLLTIGQGTSYITASAYCFVIGVGLGLSSTPMLIAVQSGVAYARRGVATATNIFVRNFGSVMGLAVMGAIINQAASAYSGQSATSQALQVNGSRHVPAQLLTQIHTALQHGIHGAFIAALVAAIAGMLIVANLPGGSARDHEMREEPAGTG